MTELYLYPPQGGRNQQQLVIKNDRPAYRVLNEPGLFAGDTLWPAGSVIYYDDTPNEEMEPLNDLARDRMREYLTFLNECAAEVAKQSGKRLIGGRKNIEEAMNDLREDTRRMELVKGDGGVPIMGAKKRGRPRVQKVGEPDVPETGIDTPKKSSVEAIG